MTEPRAGRRLHVLNAVKDGWTAFRQAPWPFVLFALLYGVLAMLFQQLPEFLLNLASNPSASAAVISLIVSMVGSILISLWGSMGLIRGAWKALDGQKPAFSDMTRWDGDAAGRLFINQIVLFILGLIIGGVCIALMVGFSQANEVLGFIPFITAAVVFIYLMVNQHFLMFLALLQDESPLSNLGRGREVVDPSWGWVLLLLIVEFAIVIIGAVLCGVGLLTAFPLTLCVSTAAYRQLFDDTDNTGFLAE